MTSNRFGLVYCAAIMLLTTSCAQPKADERETILTGDGKGKYWDIVSSANGLNRYNLNINSGGRYPYDKTRGIPVYTFFFGAKNRLMYYLNIDSAKVIDMNIVAGDIQYNPADYKLMGSTIRLIGDTSEIVLLNEDIMVLRQLGKVNKLRVYVPSPWQSKVECKDMNCQ